MLNLKIWSKHFLFKCMHPEVLLVNSIVIISNKKYNLNKGIGISSYSSSLRNLTVAVKGGDVDLNKIKLISVHVPKHLKPVTDVEFGHYLAGLIDGDGSFSKYTARIEFSELDASLAYYIKKRLGYGKVTKLRNKKAINLTITHREGLTKLLNLINGKIRTQFKYDAIYKYILNIYKKPLDLNKNFHLNDSTDLDNHWLAGFIDADGSFQIKIIDRIKQNGEPRLEVRLSLQIDQKTRLFLDLIKGKFGGNIGYRKKQDTYYYSSTSFGSAKNVIFYLDNYHLLSSKYLNYLKWRKVYILIQNKTHILPEGLDKIIKIKSTMNSNSQDELDLSES